MNVLRIREMLHAALCLLLLAGSAGAHAGGRVYPIPYLTDGMLAEIQLDDGSVDEWYDLIGEPTMTLIDFADEARGTGLDPADLDFRIWLAWHDEPARIYLAFAATDDLYKNVYVPGSDEIDNFMILQDNIFLGIDADHSGGRRDRCIFELAGGLRADSGLFRHCLRQQRTAPGRQRTLRAGGKLRLDGPPSIRRGGRPHSRGKPGHQRDRAVRHPF